MSMIINDGRAAKDAYKRLYKIALFLPIYNIPLSTGVSRRVIRDILWAGVGENHYSLYFLSFLLQICPQYKCTDVCEHSIMMVHHIFFFYLVLYTSMYIYILKVL